MSQPKKNVDPKSKATQSRKKEESVKTKKEDEKHKMGPTPVTTPQRFLQKATTADIYGKNKTSDSTKNPKKPTPHKPIETSKSSLSKPSSKSLSSSTSQASFRNTTNKSKVIEAKEKKNDKKLNNTDRSKVRTAKDLPFVNVTVNSPVSSRRNNYNVDENKNTAKENNLDSDKKADDNTVERKRTKTRTLEDDEIKILKPEIDNNKEMIKLTKALEAKSKTFFVALEDERPKKEKRKSSDEDISYEDDFESYASDFESDNSDDLSQSNIGAIQKENDFENEVVQNNFAHSANKTNEEEKMLDSGHYEFGDSDHFTSIHTSTMDSKREARNNFKEDKKTSLTDEGFQDTSGSSALSSMKINEVLDSRPSFIDLKQTKRKDWKKKAIERKKQRIKDILSKISLHQMTFSLFETNPIPHDVFMLTYGRANYMQVAIQTHDDTESSETQTDEILFEHKWTQHPVRFSIHEICFDKPAAYKTDDIFKFTNENEKEEKNENNVYDPLRIYLEQKSGVGTYHMSYNAYHGVLKDKNFNNMKLGAFLKRIEKVTIRFLQANCSMKSKLGSSKQSKILFSDGYTELLSKVSKESFKLIKDFKIVDIVPCRKSSLLLTVHDISNLNAYHKNMICLWDKNIDLVEPLKLLVAIDHVTIGRYRGSYDGIFIAALKDNSLHLWDLSNDRNSVGNYASGSNTNEDNCRKIEMDFSHNQVLLQSSYTSSFVSITNGDSPDTVVGLEFLNNTISFKKLQEGVKKTFGQVWFKADSYIAVKSYSTLDEFSPNLVLICGF